MIFLTILLLLLSTSTLAAPTQEEAQRYCRAFIEERDSYESVELPFSLNGKEYTVASSGGSCSSSSLALVNEDGFKDFTYIENAPYEGYKFGDHDKVFLFEERLFVSNGRDLRVLENDKEYLLCDFQYELKNWALEAPEKEVCSKLLNNKFNNTETPISIEGTYKYGSWEASASKEYSADLNNDGEKERIQEFYFSLGRGCGCDMRLYRAFTDHDNEDKEFLQALLDVSHGCDPTITRTVINIENEYYILQQRKLDNFKGNKVSWKKPQKKLYKFNGKKFEEICNLEPIYQKIIRHTYINSDL